MFGYVQPKECELKVREQATYRSVYCGLCKSMRAHYGLISSLSLTYDCTFLAILLGALCNEDVSTMPCRCLHAAFSAKRRYRMENPSLYFSAALNVLLSEAKFMDDLEDHPSAKTAIALKSLRSCAKKARSDYPALSESVDAFITMQNEAEKTVCIDDAAHPTAAFLQNLADVYPSIPETDKPALKWLLYNLGRWIYFADAANDITEDKKNCNYNVFLHSNLDEISFCLNESLSECRKAFDLLTFSRDEGLLENILFLGCASKTNEILAVLRKGVNG